MRTLYAALREPIDPETAGPVLAADRLLDAFLDAMPPGARTLALSDATDEELDARLRQSGVGCRQAAIVRALRAFHLATEGSAS